MSFFHTLTHTEDDGTPLKCKIPMKQNVEQWEMDHYRVYLLGHLRDHYFPQFTNKKFVEERTEAAYDTLVTLRLEGRSLQVAHELAMRTLLEGLYVSRYDIVYSVVEESLWTRVPDYLWKKYALHFLTLPEIHAVLDRYQVNGDFLERETHQPMLDELLGIMTEKLDGYEL